MSGTNFTEIGLLWRGQKSAASGHVHAACDVTLKPGQRLFVQEIEYAKGKPEKAPDFRLVVTWDWAKDDDQKGDSASSGKTGL